MTHISRPLQIALAAVVLFLAVWFFALRSHSSTTESSGSGSSGSAAQSSASSGQSSAAQSTPGGGSPASKGSVYHGSAPGVEGLSRAIQKARGAVAQSQQNAQQQQRSQSQSSQSQGAQTQTQSRSQSQTSQKQQRQTQAQQNQSRQAQNSQQTKVVSGVPPMQAAIEGELKHGKVVAVLFWNPKGSVDATVRRELRAASRDQHGKLAVHVARSSQIGSFGSFAHAVQVYSTPTILLINTHGKTSSLTGLTDAFSIGQAIKEVKHAK